ncbi:MAG TPA: EamA family transporter [Solirubrobacterales bacterium]|nr:EamA family transporter [Solirubrobacterales bacterium]
MSGAGWAAISGAGFGLFQALNARAVRDIESVYASTFFQLLVATAILAAAALATEDVSSLADASAWGLVAFALAGLVHFFVGWTTLNFSQARIGAARTSPLLATNPLWGLLFALILTGEAPGWAALGGIALTIAGAYAISDPGGGRRARLRDSGFALATAAAWALSPILTVEGLEGLDSPLLGVTVGMLAAALAYGVVLAVSRTPLRGGLGTRPAVLLKLAAGVVVALATWGRWVSLEDTGVAVVLALQLLSVPSVLVLAPIVSGRHVEVVTARVWLGALLVIAGSLLLILIA